MSRTEAMKIVDHMSIKDLEDTAVGSGVKRKDVRSNFSVKGVQTLVIRYLSDYVRF